ncbi:MAG: TPM domain-containing protein [Chthoniobacterales bacterium]
MRWLWLVILCLAGLNAGAQSSVTLPAKPTRYVSDRAFVLDEAQIGQLNARLETFERETSNQLVVAIFSRLPANAEIAQYSTQVFRSWQVGQAGKDNGIVLFIFKDDRKLFIATGRGLEGALPDVTCKQIIDSEIVPRFRSGDFPGGIEAGANAIMAATRGEYHGTGKTVGESQKNEGGASGGWMVIAFFILFMLFALRRNGRDVLVNRRGYSSFGGGWISGGGSSGGSWGGGGGGGGFSGGGGTSGGGGAGGSW